MDRKVNFDLIAKHYDSLARLVFGRSLRQSQTIFLDKIPNNSDILILGGGTGWWLANFLCSHPQSRIVYIDSSVRMLEIAKLNTGKDSRIEFIEGTEDSIPQKQFDVVITFCFLDMFSEIQIPLLIKNIRSILKENSIWIVSDFVNNAWWHAILLKIMYSFFQLVSNLPSQKLPDWSKFMAREQFLEIDGRYFFGQFIKSALYKSFVQ